MSFEHHVAKALMPDQCDLDMGNILKHVVLHARYGTTEHIDGVAPEVLAAEWVEGCPYNEDQRIYIRKLLKAMFLYLASPEELAREADDLVKRYSVMEKS